MASYFKCYLCLALVISFTTSQAQYNFRKTYERLVDTQNDYNRALKSGDSVQIAEMSYRLGKRYIGLNNYPEAQRWFHRAVAIRKVTGQAEDLGKVYAVLSETEYYMGNEVAQIHYSHLAFENLKKSGTPRALMAANRLRGGVHATLSREKIHDPDLTGFKPSPDSAAWHYRESMRYAQMLRSKGDIAMCHEFLGELAFDRGNNAEGLREFQTSIDIFSRAEMWHNVINTQTHLANIYLKKNHPADALRWLDKSLSLAKQIKDLTTYGEFSNLELAFSQYYQKIGDWKNAFVHQQLHDQFVLKERDTYREGLLGGLKVLHENETKELKLIHSGKELKLLRQNQSDHRTLILILAVICCLSTVAGLLYHNLYKKYQLLNEQNKGLVREQSHRIKNNLQSVTDLLGLQLLRMTDPLAISVIEESLSRVETISLIHRHLYRDEHLDTINLMTFIPDLVGQVLKSQSPGNVEVKYDIPDILLFVDQAMSVGLIVNELTINAGKYAFNDHPLPQLQVRIRMADQHITLDFADNGPGLARDRDKETFGMRIIELLTKKLKGISKFSNANGGCHFSLSFPISLRSKQPSTTQTSVGSKVRSLYEWSN
jgi:two-component system, sensor histidine kinase PdtaS